MRAEIWRASPPPQPQWSGPGHRWAAAHTNPGRQPMRATCPCAASGTLRAAFSPVHRMRLWDCLPADGQLGGNIQPRMNTYRDRSNAQACGEQVASKGSLDPAPGAVLADRSSRQVHFQRGLSARKALKYWSRNSRALAELVMHASQSIAGRGPIEIGAMRVPE